MYTRRDLAMMALAIRSQPSGVKIGAASFSFRDRPLDDAIQGMAAAGLGYCTLWSGHVEPRNASREELRRWRTSVPIEEFRTIRGKFRKAGIRIFSYYYNFRDDFTDAEITRGFEMAEALGATCLAASANVTTAARLNPYAAKANIPVAMHNHAVIKDNEFARPEDFDRALHGMSHIRINLDIGHFTALGYDPVEFIRQRHRDILLLDVKDRNRAGVSLPFGEGDAHVGEVLRLMKQNRYSFPAMIEYDYKGADTLTEVKRCYEFCRSALT
ncbi:MAG: sugar phosphate isomerase/epimerase [Acidobacteria bacterium]|nr:sugar phosphate isomerase/epimerase [Acidobacteriota bacterium]